MPKIVHKQKNPFGGDVYLDENYRVVGYSQKGLFGEEVYLDKDFNVSGYARKGLGDAKIFVDRDGHYAGWSGKGLGSERVAFMDGEMSGKSEQVTRRGLVGGWIFLAVVLGLIAWFVASIVK